MSILTCNTPHHPDVTRWMKKYQDKYLDPRTGELNHTKLAEACAEYFDLYEDPDEACSIPEWVFEDAVNITAPPSR